MNIRNISDRTITLRDTSNELYVITGYGQLTIDDSLWSDDIFMRWLRYRIRDIVVESLIGGNSGAPTTATYLTLTTNGALPNAVQLGNIVNAGALASRPSASIAGRLYYVNDTNAERLTRDTGSVWTDLKVNWGFITQQPSSLPPAAHESTHLTGGSDALAGNLDANARVAVSNAGTAVGTRRGVNFTGATVTDNPGAERVDVSFSATVIPSGAVVAFAGSSAPSGFLLCDGSAVSRTTFAALFAITSTTYGTGDGSTTFNLPDLRGRMPVGLGTNTDVNTLAKSDGNIVSNRRPKHDHTVNDPTHTHATSPAGLAGLNTAGGGFGSGSSGNTVTTIGIANAATGVTVGPQAGTEPLDSPAYLTVNFIIKT